MELSKIVIGAMRFKNRKSAVKVIRKAIDVGFNYIDTSPLYCFKNEKENSESWIGEAVNYKDYRQRVMVSTKCTPGNGGLGLGDFTPEKGFGIRSVEQFNITFKQSLNRLNLPEIDYYHLWTCHTDEQFQEAFKPGGWYDGVKIQQGKFKHLGLTTHADSETVIKFLKTGYF